MNSPPLIVVDDFATSFRNDVAFSLVRSTTHFTNFKVIYAHMTNNQSKTMLLSILNELLNRSTDKF